MDVKVLVATHKKYPLPEDRPYFPIHVGASLSDTALPYQRDDEGENISCKNPYYCELTALYWAYKNLRSDFIGLCHYRRYFDMEKIALNDRDLIILPKKRRYYIETVRSQFEHAHGKRPLETVREIIERDHREYLDCFEQCMNKRSLHIYNIFIMRYDILMKYCDFLFDVLFKAEEELGKTERMYGYIAERLLDVFIEANHYEYKEVKLVETEPVDWPKKIWRFLERKIRA